FAQVHSSAFRRDCPQYVGQIFIAERCGLLQIAKLNFNFGVALLAFYFGLTVRRGHQVRAGEIEFGGSAAVLVVDRLHTPANDSHMKDRHRAQRFDGRGGLRVSLRPCAQTEDNSSYQKQLCFQSISLRQMSAALRNANLWWWVAEYFRIVPFPSSGSCRPIP